MTEPASIPPRISELAANLTRPRPMRRGSINERRMKCGQAHCPCQRDSNARHGPYYTLTYAIGGKTRSRYIRPAQVPALRRQIEAGREFRQQMGAYWEACEQWADAGLGRGSTGSEKGPGKGGSQRRSKARRGTRSKNS